MVDRALPGPVPDDVAVPVGKLDQIAARRVGRLLRADEPPLRAVEDPGGAGDGVDGVGVEHPPRGHEGQAVVRVRRRDRLVEPDAHLAPRIRPVILHQHGVVEAAARVRPDRQDHLSLAVGKPPGGGKFPVAGPVPDPAHGGQVGHHQVGDERAPVRLLQPEESAQVPPERSARDRRRGDLLEGVASLARGGVLPAGPRVPDHPDQPERIGGARGARVPVAPRHP